MKLKKVSLLIIAMLVLSQSGFAQNFYHDYQVYLEGIQNAPKRQKFKDPNTPQLTIERIRRLINEVKLKTSISMFDRDTIFIVTYRGIEIPKTSILLWNQLHSCFYDYSFELKNWKINNQILKTETDATGKLNDLRPDFRKWVETIDTLNYNKYGRLNSRFDGNGVRFTVAIKANKRWSFISSRSFAVVVNKALPENH